MIKCIPKKINSTTNYHKRRIHNGTWEVFSLVTTTYEDGSTREFSNWVTNCATEEIAIATIINLKGLRNA